MSHWDEFNVGSPPKAPCYKCEDRAVTCHSTCEKYKAFQEENQEAKVNRMEHLIREGRTYPYETSIQERRAVWERRKRRASAESTAETEKTG